MNMFRNTARKDMSRRTFLKLSGLGAAAGTAGLAIPKRAIADDMYAPSLIVWDPVPVWLRKGSLPQGELFWKKVQDEFTLDRRWVYMNIGTTGSMPARVQHNYNVYNQLIARIPRWNGNPPDSGLPGFSSTTTMRQEIAPGFGCDYTELWISENTTNGLAQIFNGLPWTEWKDEYSHVVIVTTMHEHGAGLSPMYRLRDRFGVELRFLTIPILPTSGDEYVAAFEQGINQVISDYGYPPQVVFFTHTPYKTGATLPAKEICALGRSYGCVTFIDGAHNIGMFNLNFDDIGCDFYSGSGHKWQCGPGRTGIAFVRNQGGNLPKVWVTEGSYRAGAQNREEGDNIAGLLQSHGNPHYGSYSSQHDVCMVWDAIGREKIYNRVLDLSHYLKQRIKSKFGDQGTFFCPDIRELSSGLTTFNPFDDTLDRDLLSEYLSRLGDEGFLPRTTNFHLTAEDFEAGAPQTYALRFSTHLFHNYEQIDDCVEAMVYVYSQMMSELKVGAVYKSRSRRHVTADEEDGIYC